MPQRVLLPLNTWDPSPALPTTPDKKTMAGSLGRSSKACSGYTRVAVMQPQLQWCPREGAQFHSASQGACTHAVMQASARCRFHLRMPPLPDPDRPRARSMSVAHLP